MKSKRSLTRRLALPLWAVITLAALTALNAAERQIKEAGQRIKLRHVSSLPPFTALSSSFSSLLSLDVCYDIIVHQTFWRHRLTSPFGAFLSTAHDVCRISWNKTGLLFTLTLSSSSFVSLAPLVIQVLAVILFFGLIFLCHSCHPWHLSSSTALSVHPLRSSSTVTSSVLVFAVAILLFAPVSLHPSYWASHLFIFSLALLTLPQTMIIIISFFIYSSSTVILIPFDIYLWQTTSFLVWFIDARLMCFSFLTLVPLQFTLER